MVNIIERCARSASQWIALLAACLLFAPIAWGQTVNVNRGASVVRCEVTPRGLSLPVVVNGTPVNWIADTGATVTIISDTEASLLRLPLRESSATVRGFSLQTTRAWQTVAPALSIGQNHFRDVTILVVPARELPLTSQPAGRQGIIGLPLLRALGALQWSYDGQCRTGNAISRVDAGTPTRLRIDDRRVYAEVRSDMGPLVFLLDTGNQMKTQLWARFARDFRSLVKEKGRKGAVDINGIGGRSNHDVVFIPGLRILIGNKTILLDQAPVFESMPGLEPVHGLLGMDVLHQAAEITLNFDSMTLTMR
jgi:hypothetical protein